MSRTSSAPRSSALPYLITSTRAARRGSRVARLPGLAPAVAESLMVCALYPLAAPASSDLSRAGPAGVPGQQGRGAPSLVPEEALG